MKIEMEKIKECVIQAGALFADRAAASHTKAKGRADFVTDVDFAVQSFVQSRLKELYPEIGFISEEKDNSREDKKMTWVLDPVDGTTNLIHGYNASAVSLALLVDGEPVLGLIYNPYKKELFTAEKGRGAFLNGKLIRVSDAACMEESLIAVGTSPYYKEELTKENFALIQAIYLDAQDIRRSGSAALDLADVACGRTEAYCERRLKIWDYAAGLLLIQEAGGTVIDYHGQAVTKPEMVLDVIAGNRKIPELIYRKYLTD